MVCNVPPSFSYWQDAAVRSCGEDRTRKLQPLGKSLGGENARLAVSFADADLWCRARLCAPLTKCEDVQDSNLGMTLGNLFRESHDF